VGSNSDRASRIFQWLACSQRPLKKFEVQYAVTVHPDNTRIDENTRVSEHVFELCKPLVEDGPNDVIRFVHVSVKQLSIPPMTTLITYFECRYLLKNQPLFNLEVAQCNIAFSCLAYLDWSATLVDADYDENSRLIEVGKGFHGLCRYATKHWVEHFLAYVISTKDSRDSDSKEGILKAADNLAHTLSQIVPQKKVDYSQARLDPRCHALKVREPIFTLVMSTLFAQLKEKIAPRYGDDPCKLLQSRRVEILGV
jgi:hypothetical protein